VALSDISGRVYSNRIERILDQFTVYLRTVDNRSSEIIGNSADTLVIPQLEQTITVSDLDNNTDLTYQDVVYEGENLVLNQKKTAQAIVYDTDVMVVRANVVSSLTSQMARALSKDLNSYIRTQLQTTASGRTSDVTVSRANFNQQTGREAIINHLVDAKRALEDEGWFEGTQVDLFLSGQVATTLIKYLIFDRDFTLPATDEAFRNGVLSNFLGLNVFVDSGIVVNTSTAANNVRYGLFSIRGTSVTYGARVTRTETLRNRDRWGDYIRSLLIYGARNNNTDFLYNVRLDIT